MRVFLLVWCVCVYFRCVCVSYCRIGARTGANVEQAFKVVAQNTLAQVVPPREAYDR